METGKSNIANDTAQRTAMVTAVSLIE